MNEIDLELKKKCDIIAQKWFWSCDAPDSTPTAKECHRLSKLIYDTMQGQADSKWTIVNHYLHNVPELQD